ncbi:DNA circularization N-terminal domain-containing protein [Haliangium sp.]|uniref:DNA circularization N-terminal domain-containing protein n=1 Tax=Haliangium sp. TaxID=2663208 RepID=UPI003D09B426
MVIYRFEASYAGVPLQVTAWTVNRGRDVIRHRPARGTGAQLSDRGRREREDQLTIQLVGTDAEITRNRDTLATLADSGDARTFVHPLDGRWAARLSEFGEQAGAEGVTYSMTLVEDRDFSVRLAQVVQADESSIEDVTTAAGAFDEARAAMLEDQPGLAAEVPDASEAVTMATSWSPETSTSSQVTADMGQYRAGAGGAQERLDRERSRRAYNTAVALLELRGHVERYARRIQRLAPRTFALEVLSDTPLISLLSELYGGAEANRIANDVIRINSLASPIRVRAGAVLRLPARG